MTAARIAPAALLAAALAAALLLAPPALAQEPVAPGAPGAKAAWSPADKHGFGTSRTPQSEVWFTLRPGELSEVYHPDLGTPALRNLDFVVTDGTGRAERTSGAAGATRAPDARVPAYEQTDTSPTGGWRMVRRYVTDPARDSLLIDVAVTSLDGRPYQVYAVADPNLTNGGDDDRATVASGGDLIAWDAATAMSLAADDGFDDAGVGHQGTSDGGTDLVADGRLDARYAEAGPGNVVLTGRLANLTGLAGQQATVLTLGFGPEPGAASEVASETIADGFDASAAAYAEGWYDYLDGLHDAPAAAADVLDEYWASVVVNAASEDKRNPGGVRRVAEHAVGVGRGGARPVVAVGGVQPGVVARPLQARDGAPRRGRPRGRRPRPRLPPAAPAAAGRIIPQNSDVHGATVWENLQLDEVALPLVLAWQLDRADPATFERVRRSADFLVNYAGERPAPWSPQERWENQSGYSPGTIAAQIAGLVCAADLARRAGDQAAADRWLATARDWAARVDGWTVTRTGPLSPEPYYLRLTKDGDPNAGTVYDIGDGGATLDQRAVVDPSFLELVRLGVKPAGDPVVRNTLAVVDRELGVDTPAGRFWHRFTDDGYGEDAAGGPWRLTDPGSQQTAGRAWPIFAGERGEYELLAGAGDPAARLRVMAESANDGLMIAEQVWDQHAPSGRPGFPAGEGTFSATPLTWSHAQLVRLAWSIEAGHPVERPAVVTCEFLGEGC